MSNPTRRSLLRTSLAGGALWAGLGRVRAGEDPAQKDEPARKPTALAPTSTAPALKKAVKYSMVAGEGTIRQKFDLVRACGFEGVEIDSPLEIDRAAVVEASRASQVQVHGVIDSVHWHKRFSDPSAQVRDAAVAALKGAIADAKTYSASTVLVVPGAVRDAEKENYQQVWERSQAEIRKAIPAARDAGVRIAIEVVWNDFLTTPEQLVEYVDAFQDPAVGAYFDVSNMIKYGVAPADWIRKLGPRLLKVDFKGFSRSKGWVKIGEGDEDWPAVMTALGEVGYTGWLTAEVEAGERDHLLDVARRMDAILGR
jgi:hexulose-6-phosphate isomerase